MSKSKREVLPNIHTQDHLFNNASDEEMSSASESDEEIKEQELRTPRKSPPGKQYPKIVQKQKQKQKRNKVVQPVVSGEDAEIEVTSPIKRQHTNRNISPQSNALDLSDPVILQLVNQLQSQGIVKQTSIKSPTTAISESAHNAIVKQRQWIQELETPCLDHYCEKLCWCTQFAFTVATCVLLGFYASHDHPAMFVNTFFVQSIAAIAYFVKASHAGEITFNDIPVPFVRYVDWVTTTPLMLYELCHIAHAESHVIVMVIGCDLITLCLGITAAMVDPEHHFVVKYGLFAVALAFYILMVCTLQQDVAGPLYDRRDTHDDYQYTDDVHRYLMEDDHQDSNIDATIDLFDKLETLTIVTWSFYPLAVLLGRAHFGIITPSVEDGFICILDIVSKIGMEGLIIAYAVQNYSGGTDDGGH